MQVRLIPVIVFAAGAILVLKAAEFVAKRPPMAPITAANAAGAAPAQPAAPVTTTQRPQEQIPQTPTAPGAAEALNERLGERRRQLDDRQRELDQREALIRAAERRMEERVEELKRIEQRIEQTVQARQDEQNQQMRSLVVMYENMKAQDAARIFDRLDLEVLISMVTRMNPRRMAEVLAAMQPDAAQRLTVELARRSGANVPARPAPAAVGGTPVQSAPAGPRELPRVEQRRPS